MKFRKKPVVIEAWRHTIPGEPAPEWLMRAFQEGKAWHQGGDFMIRTLEGDHRADLGDWIIRGVKGELYPCKPDIFEKTYEPVAELTGGKDE